MIYSQPFRNIYSSGERRYMHRPKARIFSASHCEGAEARSFPEPLEGPQPALRCLPWAGVGVGASGTAQTLVSLIESSCSYTAKGTAVQRCFLLTDGSPRSRWGVENGKQESYKGTVVSWKLQVDKAGLLSAGHLSLAKQKGIMSL